MRLMSASAMVHSYAQEWEAATDCAETWQLWAASGLEKASVGYIEEQVRSVYTRLSCLCCAYLGGFHFKTNSQSGPNLMKTFKVISIYWKTAIATTTATSLKPPPAFVFTSMCYKYFMNAGCLGVVAVASSPLLSAAGLAAGLAARRLPRLHLCLMETAISANWTSWIMNRYVISYESKTNLWGNLKLKHICTVYFFISLYYIACSVCISMSVCDIFLDLHTIRASSSNC